MQPQVLIVGAGPTGLVLALTLLKSGVPIRIIEKSTTQHVSSRGSGVQPRIQEIEHFLGTLADIQAVGTPPPMVLLYDPEDPRKLKSSTRFIENMEPTPQFPISAALLVSQYLHEEILRTHIKAHGGNVESGTELTALEQDEDGVTVQLIKVVDGKELQESVTFPYVVGADGGHSSVRKFLGLQFIGETHEQENIVNADVDLNGVEGYGLHSFIASPSLQVALRSTNIPERFQILITGHGVADIAQECADAGQEEFQTIIRRLTDRPDLEVTKIHVKTIWKYNARMADRFQKGRVFVAGDAAHIHSPMGGQGMTSSIQDSFNLAWKLALVVKGHVSPDLLKSYEEERLPCIADMLLESSKLHRVVYGEKGDASKNGDGKRGEATVQQRKAVDALGSAAEPLTSTAASSAPDAKGRGEFDMTQKFFRGRKLFQLDLNYRWSSILFDERFAGSGVATGTAQLDKEKDAYGRVGHDLRAGDRAPDAPGLVVLRKTSQTQNTIAKMNTGEGETTRLFDIFDPTVHIALVLSFNPSFVESVQNALRTSKVPIGLVRTAVIVPRGSSVPALTESAAANVGLVLSDKEGHAYHGYNNGMIADIVVVVRPDAMIGAFATSVAGLERYLSKVFTTT